jgi:hypothetical protein
MDRKDRIALFEKFAKSIPSDQEHRIFDLVAEIKLQQQVYEKIKYSVKRYIESCLGHTGTPRSDEELAQILEQSLQKLPNLTPNGVLLPKYETQKEFNAFHETMALWLKSLGVNPLIRQVFCPVTIRIVQGTENPALDNRSYASTKTHLDLWSGDPADTINIILPMLGDIEHTTIDFFKPPQGLESQYIKVLKDYNEASEFLKNIEPYPLRPRHGFAYLFEAITPHRTVKRGGKVRVSVEFRVRQAITETQRQAIENACDKGRLSLYLDSPTWFSLGTQRYMKFKDTLADAQKGVFTKNPYNEPTYAITDQL